MTIKALYPSISPSLMLDFANTKALDPRVSFVRTTTARYYNGVTTAKAEENLQLQSQSFSASTGSTVTNNNAVAPNGASTAATFIEDGSTGVHAAQSDSITYAAATYTFSFFAKPNGRSWIALRQGGTTRAWFDVTNGVVGTTSAGVTASIVASAGSYYRCIATFTASAGAANIFFRLGDADNSDSYAGNGTSGIDIWGIQVEQRSAVTAYTPTTTQPITNYIPVLLTAASGVARFDHNPTTGESLGLLVEEQRTNLLTYSDDFANAAWTLGSDSTLTSNTVVAPDGTLTGDKFGENTANGARSLAQSTSSVAPSAVSTTTVYAKAGERSNLLIRAFDNAASANYIWANFNLLTGAINASGNSGNGTGASASITAVGNGWYRCAVSGIPNNSGTATRATIYVTTSTSNTTSYQGNGFSGLYIWGAQLEAGAFPTSYIPTVAATVTRNADVASMTGANFSSWFRADEGTLYAEWAKNGTLSFQSIASISNNTSNNLITLAHGSISGANNNMRFDINIGGASQASLTLITGSVVGTFYKTIGAYKTNDFAGVANAGTVLTDATGTIPVVDMIYIGSSGVGSALLNGHIKKFAYYSTRATNAQLQALTS